MEKKATYTVISPPHPPKRQWVAWAAAGVSVVALVVACVTAAVVNEQSTRVNHLEERLMEMEGHLEDILRLTLANDEYENYEYDAGNDYNYYDDEDGSEDGITVRRVLRRRRDVNSLDNELHDPSAAVPIYEQAYGVNLKTNAAPKGLRLYDSLLDNDEDDEETRVETAPDATESPIKPYHRVSSMWVPKRERPRLPGSSGQRTLSARNLVRNINSANGQEENEVEDFSTNGSPSRRRSPLMERRSRTKTLHGSRREIRKRQKQRTRSNPSDSTMVFRSSYVKATDRHDGYTSPNSVVPQADSLLEVPRVVPQDVGRRTHVEFSRPPTTSSVWGKKPKRPRNKQHRRRRRARPFLTVAHFSASASNSTTRQVLPGTGDHLDWTPAPWMDKLGLNNKYSMDQGTVTVGEAGLYYIYAQVLYESGRANGGFQILVDDIPILECLAPALRPAPTCLTGGISYLPRNAKVRVRDLDNYLRTIHVPRNTFFGLVKLMEAPRTAEELLLA